MNFINTLKLDIRRLFNLKLLVCSFIGFIVMTGVILPYIPYNQGVWYILKCSMSGSGTFTIILCTLPVIPYAVSLAEEHESNAIKSYIIRTGLKTYTLSKIVASLISGFLTVFITITIFTVVFIFFNDFYIIGTANSGAYDKMVDTGNQFGGWLLYAIHMSLSGSLTAVAALWMSTFIPNKYITIASPLMLFYVSIIVSPATADMPWILYPVFWLEGIVFADTVIEQLLPKVCVVVVLTVLMSIGATLNMKRRMQNE